MLVKYGPVECSRPLEIALFLSLFLEYGNVLDFRCQWWTFSSLSTDIEYHADRERCTRWHILSLHVQ